MDIQKVQFQYGKHIVLQDISFSIPEGKCCGIIGANGCGKSTLLSILAGARKAGNGTLLYQGETYSLKSHHRPLQFGYIPQDNPFIEQLSAYDNLYLWYRGKRSDFQNALKEEMIQMLGIEEFLSKKVSQLSGGMKKRLSIAAGFMNHPKVLILDEPSAALDIPCKADIYRYLTAYLDQGNTVIITTHEPDELDLCNILLVMKEGRLEQVPANLRGAGLLSHF
ncbi:MAG: ABC transporter ATP-binding protein [Lachnospiraceae bacterium]